MIGTFPHTSSLSKLNYHIYSISNFLIGTGAGLSREGGRLPFGRPPCWTCALLMEAPLKGLASLCPNLGSFGPSLTEII